MDPYRAVFYNQVKQLPTLNVDTIAQCNERVLAGHASFTLSNNRVDTIRLAAILAYGTNEQWHAAWRAANAYIAARAYIVGGGAENFVRNMSGDCVGVLFYWIRELAPTRLYTAQTAERFCMLEELKPGDEQVVLYRYWISFKWVELLYQARFHEAVRRVPSVMLGLGFREEILLAAKVSAAEMAKYVSTRASVMSTFEQLAYSTNDAELYAAACPGKEWSIKNHISSIRHYDQTLCHAHSLYDQWALVREGWNCWKSQDFKSYTQTLAELKDCILQTPNFTVEQLRKFEKVVDVSPESPSAFFNQVCAAKYLSVLLGVTEGYYRCAHTSALERVCAIAARLPIDLQHVLALRMAGSTGDVLPQRLADRAYAEIGV